MMLDARRLFFPEGGCNSPKNREVFTAVEAGKEDLVPEAQELCRTCGLQEKCYLGMTAVTAALRNEEIIDTVLAGVYVQSGKPRAGRKQHVQYIPNVLPPNPVDLLEATRADRFFSIITAPNKEESVVIEAVKQQVRETDPTLVAKVGEQQLSDSLFAVFAKTSELYGADKVRTTFAQIGASAVRLLLHDLRLLSSTDSNRLRDALSLPKSQQLAKVRNAPRYRKTIEARARYAKKIESVVPVPILELAPTLLLDTIRAAVLNNHIYIRGIVPSIHEPVAQVLMRELTATHGNSPIIKKGVSLFLKAIGRYTRVFCGRPQQQALTIEQMREPTVYFIGEVMDFQQAGVPRAPYRALYSNLEAVIEQERHWTQERGLPSKLFMHALSSTAMNIDPTLERLSKYYQKEGLEQGGVVHSLHAPFKNDGRSFGYEDILTDYESRDTADIVIDALEQQQVNKRLAYCLQQVTPEEAQAVALVFDLYLQGNDNITVDAVCTSLGISVTELSTYVEQTVLPKLTQANARYDIIVM